MRQRNFILLIVISVVICGCRNKHEETATSNNESQLFTLLPSEQTHVDFQNVLTEGLNTNILMYEYFYNGGGVAAGDVNGDNLIDLYFTSNMGDNKLYLNKGNLTFQDITSVSGAQGRTNPWKTGVTMVDINGDNKLDLYVSYSGMVREENRKNQLFINTGNDSNGIPRFSEQAETYGLASVAFSNQGYFFDFDRDGDLDVLLLNHNPKSLPILNEVSTRELLKKDDPLSGPRLLRQTNGKFEDITVQSGINGSSLSYGLGAGIADLNNDGWTDIYISNDYSVPDYFYVNDHNGKFHNALQESFGHTSQFSMGNDVADINNDGAPEVFTLDMLPEDNHRQKLLLAPDNYAKFDLNMRTGFYYQYMRNMLQLNNGDGTFSEIGQLAGISNTDWSWSALFADYDNDGWKDLHVTNGYFRDYTNLDFIKYMDDYVKVKGRLKREDVMNLVSQMPSSNVSNYIFTNAGTNGFVNKSNAWGLERASNSNGAAYADLDNDGDLDLIVNNINQSAFIYRNNSKTNHYLDVHFQGEGLNTQGIGARVIVYCKNKKWHAEQMPTRGYLSSVSPIVHFGLGTETTIDSLCVIWNSGKQQTLKNVKIGQHVTLREKDAVANTRQSIKENSYFKKILSPIQRSATQTSTNDFKRQPLLTAQFSHTGACLVKHDINRDGLDDIYVGAGGGVSAKIFIQQKSGAMKEQRVPAFENERNVQTADAVFFDADHDGDDDLYVATGGYHQYLPNDPQLQDHLYINDGRGNFTNAKTTLPEMFVSKGCVISLDANRDGFQDLFVGGRVIPGRYPEAPESYLLVNDGKGNFTNETTNLAPSLQKIGMVTDALWIDLDQDQQEELIVAGEWLPLSVFTVRNGKFEDVTNKFFNKPYSGWWNKITSDDINADGYPDLIVGNAGTNMQCRVSDQQPAELYFKDFDNNGSVDPFLCFYIQGKKFPYVTRDELLEQIGSLRSRFTNYKSYADITLEEIFKPETLSDAGHLQVNRLETTYFQNSKNGFKVVSLPAEAQFAPVHAITTFDFDNDGLKDVLLCGNESYSKIRIGKCDANYGVLLKGRKDGGFDYVPQSKSGFQLKGDVKETVVLGKTLLFSISQTGLTAYARNE